MPLVEKFVRAFILGCLVALCAPASAFMPASGVWVIEAEENGRPGRGFQLDVENEVAIFYYNGYRADGSPVFYVGFGGISNNVFTSWLRQYWGGPVMGGVRKDAVEIGPAGDVSITFTSGTRGTITFSGEPPKAITKFNFGYPRNQDGLLGTYLFAYPTGAGVIGDKVTLSRKIGPTTYGNGVVTNANGSFACENITQAALAGAIVCTDVSAQPANDDSYTFRMAGDRGTGFGTWGSATYDYPLEVWRTATASGRSTGLNEGTADSVEKLKHAPDEFQRMREARKSLAYEGSQKGLMGDSEREALQHWAREASAMARALR